MCALHFHQRIIWESRERDTFMDQYAIFFRNNIWRKDRVPVFELQRTENKKYFAN